MKNVDIIEIKPDKRKIAFIIQFMCAVVMVIFGVVTAFKTEMLTTLYLVIAINMVVLLINNLLFIKRKKLTILYIIVIIYSLFFFVKGII